MYESKSNLLSKKYRYFLLPDEEWNRISRCPICSKRLDYSLIGIPGAKCNNCNFFFYTIEDGERIKKRKSTGILPYEMLKFLRSEYRKTTDKHYQISYKKEKRKCLRPNCNNTTWNDTNYCWECYNEQKQM